MTGVGRGETKKTEAGATHMTLGVERLIGPRYTEEVEATIRLQRRMMYCLVFSQVCSWLAFLGLLWLLR